MAPAFSSGVLVTVPLAKPMHGLPRNAAVSRYTLFSGTGTGTGCGSSNGAGAGGSSDVLDPRAFHAVRLPTPTITIESTTLNCGGQATVTCLVMAADVLSLWTQLTSPVDGAWSDNGLLLVRGEATQLNFTSLKPVTDRTGFLAGLRVRSVANMTSFDLTRLG